MRILVLGNGGREHALSWKIKQSPLVDRVYCAPGNAGIEKDLECVDIPVTEFDSLINFAKEKSIELTVVGPELPLSMGIVDKFQEEGLKIFGPSKAAAELEGSKVFSKNLMKKYNIPTAEYWTFKEFNKALNFIDTLKPPFVIKAEGLASGKGVFICNSVQNGVDALNVIMTDKMFGEAGNEVVIEEFLKGEEASFFVFTDGINFIPLQSSQDHKAAYEDDKGPNTGGMGAYSPAPIVSKKLEQKIINSIVIPTISAMDSEGRTYKGILYFGLMINGDDIRVLEYNCRFGDPEAQPLIFRIKSDLVPIIYSIASGKIDTFDLEWDESSSVCVVLASKGYPGSYDVGHEIKGLSNLNSEDSYIFHAGTLNRGGKIVTNGGRVLGVTTKSNKLIDAINTAYQLVGNIKCNNLYYRNDIGRKALKFLS